MKFSSLACRLHDWIHSPTRSIINKSQKTQCAELIELLAEKLQAEPVPPDSNASEVKSRARVVERLKRDLEGLLTYAMATRHKGAARGQH